jgi:hypothetical protein
VSSPTDAEPTRGASGALGPALAQAIADYQRCLEAAAEAEVAYRAAQRAVSESRARLTALSAGARATGSRALLLLDDLPADEAEHGGPQPA